MKYLKPFNINEASNGLIIIQDCNDILLELSDLGYGINVKYLPIHSDMYDGKVNYRQDLFVSISVTDRCKNSTISEDLPKSHEVLRLISYLGSCGYEYYNMSLWSNNCHIKFHKINKYYHVLSNSNGGKSNNFLMRNVTKEYALDKVYRTNSISSTVIMMSDKEYYDKHAIKI